MSIVVENTNVASLVNDQLKRISGMKSLPFKKKVPGLIVPKGKISFIKEDFSKSEEVAIWVIDVLFPALQEFGRSGCRDFSVLKKAAEFAPANKEELISSINNEEKMVEDALRIHETNTIGPAYPFHLLNHISSGYLDRSSLWVTQPGNGISHEEDLSELNLHYLEYFWKQKVWNYEANVLSLRTIKRGEKISSGKVHQTDLTVFLDQDGLDEESISPWKDKTSGKARLEVDSIIKRKYKNAEEFRPYLLAVVYAEELKHYLDFMIQKKSGVEFYEVVNTKFLTDFIEHQLKEGVIQGIGRDPTKSGLKCTEKIERQVREGIYELSGQLVAMIPEPLAMLTFWANSFDSIEYADSQPYQLKSIKSSPYFYSGYLGARLLGQELDLTSGSFEADSWLKVNHTFKVLPGYLAKQPPERMRLAIRDAIEKKSKIPYDLDPFCKINDKGDIV